MPPKLPKSNKNLLDLMTPEHRERALARSAKRPEKVSPEWMALAELGYHFGWQAIRDVLDDKVTLDQASLLLQGARRVHSAEVIDQALAVMAGTSTKKGAFKKILKAHIKEAGNG